MHAYGLTPKSCAQDGVDHVYILTRMQRAHSTTSITTKLGSTTGTGVANNSRPPHVRRSLTWFINRKRFTFLIATSCHLSTIRFSFSSASMSRLAQTSRVQTFRKAPVMDNNACTVSEASDTFRI